MNVTIQKSYKDKNKNLKHIDIKVDIIPRVGEFIELSDERSKFKVTEVIHNYYGEHKIQINTEEN